MFSKFLSFVFNLTVKFKFLQIGCFLFDLKFIGINKCIKLKIKL